MDINWAIRSAISSGKVLLGVKQTRQYAKTGEAKLIIRAKNNPHKEFAQEKYGNVPVFTYPGTSRELGAACGKPFRVSVLIVLDPGSSDILSLIGGKS